MSKTIIDTSTSRRSITARPLRRAPGTRLTESTLLLTIAGVFAVVTLVWANSGGWHEIQRGWPHAWRSLASLSGIWTSLAGMIGLVLAARLVSVERAVGLDRMLSWHRIAGDTMGLVLGVHIVTGVMAEMPMRGGLVNTILDLTGRTPYMALTFVGSLIVGIVVVSSLKSVRQQLAYETWYFVHLTAYLGLALSFSHQITLGTVLANVAVVRWAWVLMSVSVFLFVIIGRWSDVVRSVLRPLKVLEVNRETDDAVSIVLGGPNLTRMTGEGGQFVSLRMLVKGQWWKTNPYSLSAAPTTAGMRITIRDRGDASSAVATLRKGDRVAGEGPYGLMTPDLFEGAQPLFIAGGVGVTPVCAMLQALPFGSRPIVLLRGANVKEIPHYAEIRELTEQRGGQVMTLLGRTAAMKSKDPFAPQTLRRAVPTLDRCVAFVCGPTSLTFAARKGLRDAGLPSARIHLERPWW